MIPRYTPDDVGAIWSEAHRVRTWLSVEVAACEVMAELALIPKDAAEQIAEVASWCDKEKLAQRSLEIEETTKHDVIAFLTAFEEVAGPVARHVHFGLTSSDVLDTSFAMRLIEANDLIEKDLLSLRAAVGKQAKQYEM